MLFRRQKRIEFVVERLELGLVLIMLVLQFDIARSQIKTSHYGHLADLNRPSRFAADTVDLVPDQCQYRIHFLFRRSRVKCKLLPEQCELHQTFGFSHNRETFPCLRICSDEQVQH